MKKIIIFNFSNKKKKKNKKNKLKIILINFSLLLINFFLLLKYLFKHKNYFKFKKTDFFILNIANKTFYNISEYLNIKYYKKNFFIKRALLNKISPKKKIILDCVDLYRNQNIKKWINDSLGDKFSIIFDSNNPEYLIFNVFGSNHLKTKYNNCIKIAYFTENIIPDLNEVDYALGFSHINYLDRFFKFPINNFINLTIRQNILKNPIRKKFCAAVISNKRGNFRNKFIKELSKYKRVDMGGKYNNNVGERVKKKIEFFLSYKFSISMENSEADGYTSEKIYQSFISGTIPIYFGNYMIDEIFNPKTYILIKSEKDLIKKIEYIKKIDNNDELYLSILKEKIFINNNKIIKNLEEEKIQFFLNIFNQEKLKAFRKNN